MTDEEFNDDVFRRISEMRRRLDEFRKINPNIYFEDGMPSCCEVRLDGFYNADMLRLLADALEPKE